MLVKGDAKCLHCGYISGQWVGRKGAPITWAGLEGRVTAMDPGTPVRCLRCGGPVFLDDAAAVANSYRLQRIQRMRAQLAALEARGSEGEPLRPAA